jgi:hypothetical protein
MGYTKHYTAMMTLHVQKINRHNRRNKTIDLCIALQALAEPSKANATRNMQLPSFSSSKRDFARRWGT